MSNYKGTYTDNLNLSKDDVDDSYDVRRVNSNSDKIDKFAGEVTAQLKELANSPKMQYTSSIQTVILKSISENPNWISPQWNLKKYDTSYFIDQEDNTLIQFKKSGLYLINFAINIPVVFNTNICIKLVKNFGTTGAEEFAYESKLGTTVSTRSNLSTINYFNENETLKCLVYQDSVNDVNLICGYGFPMISVTKVGEI